MTDQNFKTSFIPSKPIQPVSRGGGLGRGHGSLPNVVTLIIFLLSIVTSGVVFGYRVFLEKQVAGQIAQLETVRKTLDSPLVNEADRLNTRIESVKNLLQDHLAPSEIFNLLEQSTLKTVQFRNMTYTAESDGTIKISANGVASGYEAIVLQSEQYGKTGYLRDVLFTNLQPAQQGGGVTFSLAAALDKSLVLYKSRIKRESGSVEETNSDEPDSGDSFEFPSGSPTQ
ncbi:MAG TPA: hypothetical protein P5328_02695 [Candidatus Paceibacterota bacterium]|nr:hypothetical protein [Candidatus Paceibacterota bacterium]HRZ34349.1 hypothetical protein [Candidatus Paceibacterota bacterium]